MSSCVRIVQLRKSPAQARSLDGVVGRAGAAAEEVVAGDAERVVVDAVVMVGRGTKN